jgi:hypothetical protein
MAGDVTPRIHLPDRRSRSAADRERPDADPQGAPPRELPGQFATSFELVINMKVEVALSLTVPPRLLVDAELVE